MFSEERLKSYNARLEAIGDFIQKMDHEKIGSEALKQLADQLGKVAFAITDTGIDDKARHAGIVNEKLSAVEKKIQAWTS